MSDPRHSIQTNLSGLKQADLTPCAICGKGLAHDHSLNFYRVAIESHVINLPAVRRQHGLEAFLGSPALARAMGMDEDMTVPLTTTGFVNICFDCAVKWHVPGLLETIDEKLVEKETTTQSAALPSAHDYGDAFRPSDSD